MGAEAESKSLYPAVPLSAEILWCPLVVFNTTVFFGAYSVLPNWDTPPQGRETEAHFPNVHIEEMLELGLTQSCWPPILSAASLSIPVVLHRG